ncbi:Arc family DNA-binding protein [Edwardsiella tarda]|uniref:Arc family DNA-binding protein n=1 Tax=Edwardsiella tarda TaxID=636 RepID=UPI0005599BD4|nr:Arc family DNA-binding protein [Edwardsiella tarda]
MSEKQVRDYDKFMLRFPDGMRDAIAERAKQNGRSMNSEIIQILQDAIDVASGKVSTGNGSKDKDLQGVLLKLRRHTLEQDMLLNEFVHILNKKPT